jgi:hypothetical protein
MMKNTVLFILLSLFALPGMVSAEEEIDSAEYYKKYCTDMAEQAGIENEEDFSQFVKDCLESYLGPGVE